jgi:hypothetical protein
MEIWCRCKRARRVVHIEGHIAALVPEEHQVDIHMGGRPAAAAAIGTWWWYEKGINVHFAYITYMDPLWALIVLGTSSSFSQSH